MNKKFKKVLLMIVTFFIAITTFHNHNIVKAEDSLNDWNVKINWGDPKDNIPDDWYQSIDHVDSFVVKTQITLEYKGEGDGSKTYTPGEIKISLNDIADLINYDVLESNITSVIDFDASADTSATSGDKDWYYITDGNVEDHTFTFFNKNPISGAFTSTIQAQLTFKTTDKTKISRFLKYGYEKDIKAVLFVDGYTLESNTIRYNWEGIQDEYAIKWQSISQKQVNRTLADIPKEEWNNYIFLNTGFNFDYSQKHSLGLKDGWHIDFNFPNDFIVGDFTFSNNPKEDIFRKLNGDTKAKDFQDLATNQYWRSTGMMTEMSLAIPKKYLDINNGILDLDIYLYGTYLNENNEKLLSKDTRQINLNNYKIGFDGNLYSTRKTSSKEAFLEVMKENYGKGINEFSSNTKTQDYNLYATALYYGKEYNLIIGDDLQYFIYNDNTSRRFENDERAVSSIRVFRPIQNKDCSFEIYGKKLGNDEYEKIVSDTLTSNYKNISVKSLGWYYDIKVKFLNLNESVNDKQLLQVDFYTFNNDQLDNGKVITKLYNSSYLQIETKNNGSYELEEMDYKLTSNIEDMNQDIKDYSSKTYDNTILRGMASTQIKEVYFSGYLSGTSKTMNYDDENIYFDNTSLNSISIQNPATIENATLLKYCIEFDIPENMMIPLDSFKIKSGNNVLTMEDAKTQGINIFVKEQAGKITVTINRTDNPKQLSILETKLENIIFSSYISRDDYVLYKLSGKTKVIKATIKDAEVIDNDTNKKYEFKSNTGNITLSIPSIPVSSYQGINKEVKTVNNVYTKQQAKTYYGEDYSYKLKISAGQTKMANIILYDNLENYDKTTWKGIFNGLNFDTLNKIGVDTSKFKVYYSDDREQIRDLKSNGWILSTEWDNSLSDVKSIAIDMQEYVLNTNQIGYIEVLMKAPEDNVKLGSITKNQFFCSYIEYDDKDSDLSNPLKTTIDLPSNIPEVVLGDVLVNVEVNKIWNDDNNSTNIRPKNISVTLLQDNQEVDKCIINSSNDWKYTFKGLRKFDDNNQEHVYTVKEEDIFGYDAEYEYDVQDLKTIATITNTPNKEAYTSVKGTKRWNDYDNKYKTRPNSITINLLRNGTKIDSTTTNQSKDWKYEFKNLPKYAETDVEYVYTILEEKVDGYTARISKNEPKGVKIKFSDDCETESVNYDWVQIFYKKDGKIYSLPKLGGRNSTNTLKGAEVLVPSKDFYLHWKTDYSGDSYYGFKIDSIEEYNNEIADGSIVSNLPVSEDLVVEKTGNDFPESLHGNYGNRVNDLYHYVANIESSYNLVNSLDQIPQKELTITKSIYKEDINFAYGNPVSIFKIEGHDIEGNSIIKYMSVEFTEEYINNETGIKENGLTRVDISQKVILPLGEYTVSEIDNLRYKLVDIDTVNEKSKTSSTVTFDLEANSEGSVRFINRCTNFNDLSHNDIIINKIKKGN